MQIIAAAWTQIGIKTSVNVQDVSTLWGPDGYQWNDKMTACLYSWFNSNDPDDVFYWNYEQHSRQPDRQRRQRPRLLLSLLVPDQDRRSDDRWRN